MKASAEKIEYWRNHLNNWKVSGVSRRKYCEENEININTFGYWIQRLKKLENKAKSFVRLEIKEDLKSEYEITVKNKYKIKINNNFNSENLKKLICTLESL